MQIHTSIRELRNACSNLAPIALVPTMGNLHEGHLSLVETARRHCQTVVVSIFVNRLQFSPNEDFDRYPRTFSADCDKLAAAGADLVFAPGETELYPVAQQFFVDPPARLDDILEGAARPGHFRGVATVVLKLFNIVAPQVAVFGKKDYQQLQVIRHMVEQLALPIEIVGEKICRDTDGLALSSRNGYLSASERAEAPRLYRLLTQIRAAVESGHQDFALLEKNAAQELDRNGWQVDYISLRRQADLLPPSVGNSEPLVVLAAARLGNTRLIDNLEIGSRS